MNAATNTGQTAIITGAASGIGLAQARLFLEHGERVWGCDLQENAEIRALLARYPDTFTYYDCDLRDAQAIHTFSRQVLQQAGKIDLLLNTAGILDAYRPTLETSPAQWDNVMNTNVKSMFLLTNEILPSMLKQENGVIVNMASIAGLVAGGGGAAYTAAKHAIIGYTKQLDYDYASQGIRANCIAPGAIKTPMNQADFTGDQAMAKMVARQTPALRWAEPEEVAELSYFLASKKADYIHGAVIPIDGGWIEK
ncbi:3-oxoacyl-ACP reductase [Ligilactobacillus salitolerans]|uniref:3-oxoacyl-ACP reductase n=1 Tax=Ligilactobacillus salitolerans TaxID=1808352 RepID=A0A401IVC4_9LACO|nr:3-oxoacyl-ACP reductase [Ligilactobacillus salitolerans]GBG95482.1 3-oxoacyl-ACP reductase [Ligilactobacillus salitolerans]